MNLIQHFPRSKLNLFYVTYIELRLVLLCGLQSLLSFKSRFFTPARTLVAVFYFIKIHYSLDSLRKYNEITNMKQKTELLNLLDLAFSCSCLCASKIRPRFINVIEKVKKSQITNGKSQGEQYLVKKDLLRHKKCLCDSICQSKCHDILDNEVKQRMK